MNDQAMSQVPATYLQMVSTLTNEGELRLELIEKETPKLKPEQVLIQVEAAPINPSDLGVLFGWANVDKGATEGTGPTTTFTAPVAPAGLRPMAGRAGKALPVGNEGAGRVVATGDAPAAQALMGKVVAAMGGGMYAQFRRVEAAACLPLLPEHTPRDGASSFVNPLTALGMVETMQREGHSGLIHTAAASNLGQMLNRICMADGVPLVNIVRKREQAELLKNIGANFVVDSGLDSFMADLTEAIRATGATLAFDAVGGGTLASQILSAMERAAPPDTYSIYGSTRHKQVYLYGSLDNAPTTLNRSYGMAWGVGGWLLPSFLARAGQEVGARLTARVAAELKTTFASHYTDELSLTEALHVDAVGRYVAKKTGEKFLICPHKGI